MTRRQILTYSTALLIMLVGTERAAAVYVIPSDTSIGTWDDVSRTYTLTTDVSESSIGTYVIEIDEDNLTLDGDGYTVYGSAFGIGVYVQDKTGITIVNVNLDGCGCGVLLHGSDNCTVTGNTVSDSNGIYLWDSDNCTITGNTVSDGYGGINVEGSDYCTVTDNTVSDGHVGIGVWVSDYCTVTDNTVSDRYDGINVGGSDNCTVTDNTVSDGYGGINVCCGSDNCTVTDNTVSDNEIGIRINSSTGCQIYNNNFIYNTQQCSVNFSTCVFYLPVPVGGNYWSNWTTPDTDADGFVDSPYVFGGGQDNLPWVVPNGWITITPQVRIEQLITEVVALNLPPGIANSLASKLDAAKKALEDVNENNDVAAINALGAFINAVEAQCGKKILEEDADSLIDAVQQIIDLLTDG